jgi:hypothetical protein
MAISINDIDIDSEIMVKPDFGMGNSVWAKVTDIEPEGKNGRDTIGYETRNGDGRWAYMDQVVRVIKK